MTLEIFLLCSLIFVFIISFCGLLQKIKHSYDRERIIAERIARRRTLREESSDVYINTTFVEDFESSGVFPGAPPPYSHVDEPPKYEDLIKNKIIARVEPSAPPPSERIHTVPPPYSITM